jgi:hypothetical protein
MEDIIKRGIYNKITEVVPSQTFFIAHYSDGIIRGTGLNITGWDQLNHGIVKLQYRLSTGRRIINIPRYKSYQILIEASMSIDKNGGLNNKNYHYVYIKGLADKCVYVHRIALRNDPNLGQQIGNIKVYTEEIPTEMMSSWKMSNY